MRRKVSNAAWSRELLFAMMSVLFVWKDSCSAGIVLLSNARSVCLQHAAGYTHA